MKQTSQFSLDIKKQSYHSHEDDYGSGTPGELCPADSSLSYSLKVAKITHISANVLNFPICSQISCP